MLVGLNEVRLSGGTFSQENLRGFEWPAGGRVKDCSDKSVELSGRGVTIDRLSCWRPFATTRSTYGRAGDERSQKRETGDEFYHPVICPAVNKEKEIAIFADDRRS
jgi:hypothetical protein